MPVINNLEQFRYALVNFQSEIFEDVGTKIASQFKLFMKKGDTSDVDYRTATIAGFGQHFQKPELTPIRYDTIVPGRERVTTWQQYALGWRVSDVLMRRALKSKRSMKGKMTDFANFTKLARRSANWTMEAIAADAILRLDEAAPSALWVGAGSDGKAFAAADHPLLKSSATWTNLSTATTLTSTSLQEAITMLRTTPDESGAPTGPATRYVLVVGPYWEWRVDEILGTKLQANTNNNNIDPLNKVKDRITVVVNDYLPATFTGWGIFDADNLPLQYFIGMEPTFVDQRDFDTSAHLFKSEFEFSTDFHSSRGGVYNGGA